MDIDRYIANNNPDWARLARLTSDAGRSASKVKLEAEEVDELLSLYQRAGSSLTHVRAKHRDPQVTHYLSSLLTDSRSLIYARRSRVSVALGTLASRMPAAVYRMRRSIAVAATLFLVLSFAIGIFLAHNRQALDTVIPRFEQQQIAESEFANYYQSMNPGVFSAAVQANNIKVALIAIASGPGLAIFPTYVLWGNALNVGAVGAVMHVEDKASTFWGLILPHGLLEITAVLIAAGAGLHLGMTVVRPGNRSRGAALAEEGRQALYVALLVTIALLIAGFLEAFVTPSGLHPFVTVAIGFAAEIALLAVCFVVGKERYHRLEEADRAHLAGTTGRSVLATTWEQIGVQVDQLTAAQAPPATQ